MKTNSKLIDLRRFQESRDHAGEWRVLRAKIRHIIDRTCALAAKVANDEKDARKIDRIRECLFDYIAGRPMRMTPYEIAAAIGWLLELDNHYATDRARRVADPHETRSRRAWCAPSATKFARGARHRPSIARRQETHMIDEAAKHDQNLPLYVRFPSDCKIVREKFHELLDSMFALATKGYPDAADVAAFETLHRHAVGVFDHSSQAVPMDDLFRALGHCMKLNEAERAKRCCCAPPPAL
jgi:hypothetical protein